MRQCTKRLWLEIHRPERRAAARTRFDTGHRLRELALRLHDPQGRGERIDTTVHGDDYGPVLERTRRALRRGGPVSGAALRADQVVSFADLLLPSPAAGDGWRLVAVKASASVQDHHRDDVAVQAFVARSAGVRLGTVSIATIDTGWTYAGDERYDGLLTETDLTDEVDRRADAVRRWIAEASAVAGLRDEPARRTGVHCTTPYPCAFTAHCRSVEPRAEFPVALLPGPRRKSLEAVLEAPDVADLRQVPDTVLTPVQLRVKLQTIAGEPWIDRAGARAALAAHRPPAWFLDVGAVRFAVPVWAGTRPFQPMPFQFSVHRLLPDGTLGHTDFLDLTGADPTDAFVAALVEACTGTGPVFVFDRSFDTACIAELARHRPPLAAALEAIGRRLVDLQPIVRDHYYHPAQRGRFSLMAMLESMAPACDGKTPDAIRDDLDATAAHHEAIAPGTPPGRRLALAQRLRARLATNTSGMVRIWRMLTGAER